MEDLSMKAKIVYAALDSLGARSEETKVTSYAVQDYIEENEELQEHELLKDIPEQDFVDIISMKINGQRHNLRGYFIK